MKFILITGPQSVGKMAEKGYNDQEAELILEKRIGAKRM